MLGAMTSLVATEDWEAMAQLGQPLRTGATLPRLAPFGLFSCRDGHVAIVAPQDKMAHDLLRAMGREDLLDDPRYGTRDGRVTEPKMVETLVEEWTSQRTVDEVLGELKHARIAIAPVRTQAEALNDPRVVGRGETRPVSHPDQGDTPGLRTSGSPDRVLRGPDRVRVPGSRARRGQRCHLRRSARLRRGPPGRAAGRRHDLTGGYPSSPSNRTALSFRMSGRTSSLIGIWAKSASHRSGVMTG